MNINSLTNDEFIVECDVRNIRGVAIDSYNQLKAQLAAEQVTSVLIPNRAHQAARKNPKREITLCKAKLQSLKSIIQSLENTFNQDEYTNIYSRLLHVEGRIQRISRSKVVKEFVADINDIIARLKDSLNLNLIELY